VVEVVKMYKEMKMLFVLANWPLNIYLIQPKEVMSKLKQKKKFQPIFEFTN
jgi:hypothetical protein